MKRVLVLLSVLILLVSSACSKMVNKPKHEGHGLEHSDHSSTVNTTKAIWELSAVKPQAQSNVTVTIQIQDDKGNPVEKYDINHEKLMHLIVVSKDLSYFNHIHPEHKGKGQFEVQTQFPSGGEYKLIADYIPTGQKDVTQSTWIKVEGTIAAAAPIETEKSMVKAVSGNEITLSSDSLKAGKEVNLKFHIVDENTKKSVTDLQPYLGAVGHVVILSTDTEQYLHVHPTEEKASGPDAKFMTTFPKSGVYKIWGQFQRGGKTFVVSYVVKVS